MDELDKRLYYDLNLPIELPDEYENIIKNCFTQKKKHHSLSKIIGMICASLILTIGIVYAGSKIYNVVWKEPEKIVGFNIENNNTTTIEDETIMSEKEAKQKANDLLKKIGHEGEFIKSIEMTDNFVNYEKTWNITTDKNTKIYLNASNNESFNIQIDNVLNKNIEKYRTTEKQAENTARHFCRQYGYNLDEYTHVKISSNLNSEEDSYIWHVHFYKEYNKIVNPYENICISFIPEINEIYSFSVSNRQCENNPVEITKDRAKEIALEQEKKINTKYEISNTVVEKNIVSMNGDAYLRMVDYEQLNEQSADNYPSKNWVSYRTDSRVRIAWVVTIKYDIPDNVNKTDDSYNINDEQFSYYIDVTTGEVIGGCSNYEKMVKQLYN